MDAAIETVLAEYEKRNTEEHGRMDSTPPKEMMAMRDSMLLTVGREVGMMLNMFAHELKAKRILELGTSYGYSTILLAEAARENGGRVITLDLAQSKQDYAKEKLSKLGLAGYVEFHHGDALDTLKKIDGPIDLVLLDIWKELYVPCLELFYPKLAHGAVIVADNMIFPPMAHADAHAYRTAVRALPHMQSILLPIGQGVEISRYVKDLPQHLV
jgi:predicted O-methyltransferase YrrM